VYPLFLDTNIMLLVLPTLIDTNKKRKRCWYKNHKKDFIPTIVPTYLTVGQGKIWEKKGRVGLVMCCCLVIKIKNPGFLGKPWAVVMVEAASIESACQLFKLNNHRLKTVG